MKVAYYLSRFPRLSETFILREICMLREQGMDVQVFSMLPPKQTQTMHAQVQSLLPYAHYSPLFSWKILSAQLYFLLHHPRRYFRALRNVIWQTLPEPSTLLMALILFPKSVFFSSQLQVMGVTHVHAHFVWLNGVAAQVASDLLGIPCSLHAHAWDIFRRKVECVRRQLILASCVVTVSEYHRRYLLSILNTDQHKPVIHIVHYGLDPSEFEPVEFIDERKQIEIISVGRLVEKKGFKYLIDACTVLVKNGCKFHCSIIGEGQREILQNQVDQSDLNNYVSLLGEKNITEIINLYRNSDIFVLPCIIAKSGDRDGMPNVLLEAMAMQIPIITTPVAGNPELIQDGINGLLVPEADSVSLAHSIESLMKNPSLRRTIGSHARQTILEGYDIHKTSARMGAIFHDLRYSNATT